MEITTEINLTQLTPQQLTQVQKLLGVNDDGVIGPNTLKAFGDFKKRHYLAKLETIGPASFKILQEEYDIRQNPSKLQLSKDFYLGEFLISQTASRFNIPNIPNQKQIDNLKALCTKILQPLRDHYGRPIIISSGYRSLILNKRIGGATNSSHTFGEAADFTIPGISNKQVWDYIAANFNYDQVILEFYGSGNSGWVHVSYSNGRIANRKQKFKIS